MKIKSDFVTNSSSSSFVILKKNLTPHQIFMIKNHMVNDQMDFYDRWEITETEDEVRGYTCMDNYDIGEYLEKIGVNGKDVTWDEYPEWEV